MPFEKSLQRIIEKGKAQGYVESEEIERMIGVEFEDQMVEYVYKALAERNIDISWKR